jgi:antitoxin (DNA-binding transcriptional repressor) of toxin-antitoxin stability system
MKWLNVSEFRQHCFEVVDALPVEGIVIKKRGRAIAKITPVQPSCSDFIGTMPGLVTDPQDDLLSTGITWNWGD